MSSAQHRQLSFADRNWSRWPPRSTYQHALSCLHVLCHPAHTIPAPPYLHAPDPPPSDLLSTQVWTV